MKIGVLLSGCGVYDGSEIQEAVFTLLAIEENGAEAVCFAPDKDQAHVINHIDGSTESGEKRNTLKESARISRGKIQSINKTSIDHFDALVIPGGFGAAKNLNKWAFEGPDGDIDHAVKSMILDMVTAKKPIAALCMGPTVIAKALQGSGIGTKLTVGTDKEASPYDIKGNKCAKHFYKLLTEADKKLIQPNLEIKSHLNEGSENTFAEIIYKNNLNQIIIAKTLLNVLETNEKRSIN
mgnify:CR=1 FL=1